MKTIENIEDFKSSLAGMVYIAGILIIVYAIWWAFQNNLPWTTKDNLFLIGIAMCPLAEVVKRLHVPSLYRNYLSGLELSELRHNRDLDSVSFKSKQHIIAVIEHKTEHDEEEEN